jgi:hypothetical protein
VEDKITLVEKTLKSEESSADWQKLSKLLGERDLLYEDLEKLYFRLRDLTDS